MMLAQVNVTAPANMWEIAPNILDAIIAVIRQLDTDPTPVIARVGDLDITAIWVSDSDQLGSCIELHATRPDNGSGPGYGWIVPSMYHDTDWAFTGTPERFADSALDATTLTAISGLLNSLTGVNEATASAGPDDTFRVGLAACIPIVLPACESDIVGYAVDSAGDGYAFIQHQC